MKRNGVIILFLLLFPHYCFCIKQNSASGSLAISQLKFRENKGQWNNDILYQSSSANANINFIKNGMSFGYKKLLKDADKDEQRVYQLYVWNLTLAGINEKTTLKTTGRTISNYNYLKGNDFKKHIRGVGEYNELVYENVYQNIDVKYYAQNGNLKYDFVVKPGGDINRIAMQCEGVGNIELNRNGVLEISTPIVSIQQEAPYSYQIIEGRQKKIKVKFQLLGKNSYGFKAIERYDTSKELIIDPLIVEWGSFLQGIPNDYGELHDIAIDKDGAIYGAGFFENIGFPTTPGSFQTAFGGGSNDAVIYKMNADGSTLIYCTYLGGTSTGGTGDAAYGIAVTDDKEVYVGGKTTSINFPVTAGAYKTLYQGPSSGINSELFVSKLSKNGDSLLYSTFLGGGLQESFAKLTLNSVGELVVCGQTFSADFPTTNGCFDNSFSNGIGADGFLCKLNSTLSNLAYSTYFGGNSVEAVNDFTLNDQNEIFITGNTRSADFPYTAGAYKAPTGTATYPFGETFVIAFKNDASSLLFSTVVGDGAGTGIRLDASNDIVVIGSTQSTAFPVTGNAFQSSYKGGYSFGQKGDGTIAKLSSNGTSLSYSSYYGGAGSDDMTAIEIGINGYIYISGSTTSADFSITPCNMQSTYFNTPIPGGTTATRPDMFLSVFDSDFTLKYSTYIGGTYGDVPYALELYGCYDIIVCGASASYDFPTTSGSFQPTKYNTTDGANTQHILFKLSNLLSPDFTNSNPFCGVSVQFINIIGGTACDVIPPNTDNWYWSFGDGNSSTQQDPLYTYTVSGSYEVKMSIGCSSDTVVKTITVNGGAKIDASALPDIICAGQSSILSTSNGGTYNWSLLNSPTIILSTSIAYTVSPAITSNYLISYGSNCIESDTVLVTVYPAAVQLNATASHDSVCFGESTTLSVANGTSYVWTSLSDPTSTLSWSAGFTITPIVTAGYVVKNATAGCTAGDTITVVVNYYPTVEITTPAEFCYGEPLTLTAGTATNYYWKFLGNNSDTLFAGAAFITAASDTSYVVIGEQNKCIDSDTVRIVTKKCFPFYIPNSFSPNGDGLNDYFTVAGDVVAPTIFNMLIYDRWGELIFETADAKGWNGTVKVTNEPAQEEVYTYDIATAVNKKQKGHVVLVR